METEVLSRSGYEKELKRLQVELVRLQEWIVREGLRVVVLFEGRDTAGKGGVIRRIAERTNPRVVRTAALGMPSDRERGEWYFQRYVAHLPAAGEMVLFDRSWYNRAGVERVMGFCTTPTTRKSDAPARSSSGSSRARASSWFRPGSRSATRSRRPLQGAGAGSAKRWKLSRSTSRPCPWVDYAEASDEIFAYTDTGSPWFVVEADDNAPPALICRPPPRRDPLRARRP